MPSCAFPQVIGEVAALFGLKSIVSMNRSPDLVLQP
jgi:hypothetical protein